VPDVPQSDLTLHRRVSRRSFAAGAVSSLAAVALVYRLPGLLGPRSDSLGTAEHQQDWVFVVDLRRCIGCGRCVVACKQENNVPPEPEYTRTWVERYVVTADEQVLVDSPEAGMKGFAAPEYNEQYEGVDIARSFYVPKLCNQCERPPCVQVCPVSATYKTPEGVVLVNRDRCIGCRYCIQACPYGARYLDPREGVADKCTWCYHRITQGRLPACVEACPVQARLFGSLSERDSSVSQALARFKYDVLKPELGTRPQVRYIGMEEGVR
jgi:tetrathionate reductase subunit B